MGRRFSFIVVAVAWAGSQATAGATLTLPPRTATPAVCVGDCDGGGGVTVDELLKGVSMLLGTLPIDECPSFDRNGDGEVTVDELIAAVGDALYSCASLRRPTPSGSPTPISGLPDLVAFDVAIAPPPARGCVRDLGEVPRLRVCVRNDGHVVAGPFSVALNGQRVWRVNGLDAATSVCLFGALIQSGEVRVDAESEVKEVDEDDNSVRFSLPWPTLPATCTPTKTVTPSPTEFFPSCCSGPSGSSGCRNPRAGTILCDLHAEAAFPPPYECNALTRQCELPSPLPTRTPSPTPTGSPALPDLLPSDVSIAPAPRSCIGDIGEVPRLRVCVLNQGATPAGSFGIEVNGQEFSRIDALAGGAQHCVDGPFVLDGEVVTDDRDEVHEANERNNTRSFALPIPTPPPPCTPQQRLRRRPLRSEAGCCPTRASTCFTRISLRRTVWRTLCDGHGNDAAKSAPTRS